MNEGDYENTIGKYIKALGNERAEDTLYEKRLFECKNCDYLHSGTCNACGCYVELRAAAKNASCPKKKW